MIIPCMNSTSACVRAGKTPLVDGGRVLLGCPGAPGCTTTGPVAGFDCCPRTGNESKAAAALDASSTAHTSAETLAERGSGWHAPRKRPSLDFSSSLDIFRTLVPSSRNYPSGRTIIIQLGKFQ